ncbi:MAG: hypothetical protein LBT04_02900, partial [Prevotellaceae bacterium]|nr:hypothetical protein [Prevotellaceae bacterium]
MKKKFTFMVALATSVGVWAQPQTQVTYATHGLTAGDIHQTYSVTYCEPLVEGANVVWDYSAATLNGGVFSEALANGTDDKNVVVTNPDGTLFTFNVTSTGNEYYGYAHGNYSVAYDQPMLKTRFPQDYLDQFSGEFSGRITFGNSTVFPVEGTYSTTVDAYGTIILPNGKVFNDVLRVKTTERYTEHYHGYNHEADMVKYLWYTSALRYPIFVTHIYNTQSGNNTHVQKSSHVSAAALEYVAPQEKAA